MAFKYLVVADRVDQLIQAGTYTMTPRMSPADVVTRLAADPDPPTPVINLALRPGLRIEQIVAGGRNIQVRDADRIPADKVALIQMTSDVIDMISGMAPTAVPWVSPDGFTLYWLIMAIQVPRVRADYDGQSGIVIGEMP